MLRTFRAFFFLGVSVVSIPAAAQEATDKPPPSTEPPPAPAPTGTLQEEGPNPVHTSLPGEVPPAPPPPTAEAKAPGLLEGWQTELHGYFRAPMALGISSRPSPQLDANGNMTGPSSTQVSYGPNRTVDASYYSFAYTRLQEQDWVEVYVHAKRKHVDAAVGWMGYWLQGAAAARNYDAAWVPGLASLTLDTDLTVAGVKPNIALTVGAWWPKFGYFEKYDTYTLGRFRQIGAQPKLTVPVTPDLTVTLVGGFGTPRDGTFNVNAPALYGTNTGIDLLTYVNLEVSYKKYFDIGLHYNTQWTADPRLTPQTTADPKDYDAASQAHLTVAGAEVTVAAPYAGRLWISPSVISVRNGWAIGSVGTEVMHSLGGIGVATNYLAWTNSPSDSTGSGSMFNLGFLYENSLSNVEGRAPGSVLPDVTLNVFGLLADASLDLPSTSKAIVDASGQKQASIKQFKYGADVTLQALSCLAFMVRYDLVNYDLDHPAYIFSAITQRVALSTHFLSGERIYLQYSRYTYGDKMVLAGLWPWNTPLVAGNDILQNGPYAQKKPDEDVVKLQAEIAF